MQGSFAGTYYLEAPIEGGSRPYVNLCGQSLAKGSSRRHVPKVLNSTATPVTEVVVALTGSQDLPVVCMTAEATDEAGIEAGEAHEEPAMQGKCYSAREPRSTGEKELPARNTGSQGVSGSVDPVAAFYAISATIARLFMCYFLCLFVCLFFLAIVVHSAGAAL